MSVNMPKRTVADVSDGASLPDQRRLARELYQRCFFPRAIMSPADAAYVAKMIARLHEYGCQGFSVLYAYDHVSLASNY